MPDLHYYRWEVKDWRADGRAMRLTPFERGAYRDLLDMVFMEGGIPADLADLHRYCGCTEAEFRRTWERLECFFEPHPDDDDLLINDKMYRQRVAALTVSEKAARAGEKSGQKRRLKSRQEAEQNANERRTNGRTKREPQSNERMNPR